MGDSYHPQSGRGNSVRTRVSTSQRPSKGRSGLQSVGHKILSPITTWKNGNTGSGIAVQAASFLLKVAVLETVRRLSKARCPAVWSGLQGLQVFCYPPLKWIQRWKPFGVLIEGLQMLSQPFLVLSIATAFTDDAEDSNLVSGEDSQGTSDPNAASESHQESLTLLSTSDTRTGDDGSRTLSSANCLVQLHEELRNQGITLPARINDEELNRFYTAANGEFPCLLSSVKKTISWRETYRILSGDELEMWSNMVFWHGFDMNDRPCLVVRLGLACTSLLSDDRPRFAQAVVSQVEHGVLHLVNRENPQITVLVDCEGLSPLKIPMQMMKSCSTLLQDHFPNRLGCLFIIRLPSVARVVLQTFLQVLKPITRKKLKIEGDMYQRVLSECFQTLPSYLGGDCRCTGCVKLSMCGTRRAFPIEASSSESNAFMYSDDDFRQPNHNHRYQMDMFMNVGCDQVIRAAILSVLIFAALVAFLAGLHDPESRPYLPPWNGTRPP